MAKKITKSNLKNAEKASDKGFNMVFDKENYKWMIIGLAVIVVGFALMVGKTDDVFGSEKAFEDGGISFASHLKITVAPIVVLIGFAIEIFAIMKKPKIDHEPS